MIRSLYSGVAGLKTQQTKMDVIGNNIANVGTYGFKSDRATFKDVYYQTTQTATASTGNVGGTNAKQIGYGNLVGSIDTNTKTSAMSSTGYGLDIAIAGEGFLQVMGADGNIMYTKAGMLDIDADGNLVDVNGNFVLGVSGSDTTVPPASNKIRVNLPYLDPKPSEVQETINNVEYTITSANSTDKANVNFTFVSSSSLPVNQRMVAKISGDSVVVTLNAGEKFKSMADINAELNRAIKAANGGVEHPAGDFTIEMVPEDVKFQNMDGDAIELKGSEIVGTNFGTNLGKVELAQEVASLFKFQSVGENFSGDTREDIKDSDSEIKKDESFNIEWDGSSAGDGSMTITVGAYTGKIDADRLKTAGTVMLTNGTDETDSIVISYPSLSTLKSVAEENQWTIGRDADGKIESFSHEYATSVGFKRSEPSRDLGLSQTSFKLTGGTDGGEQTVANLTSISINQEGHLVGVHDAYGIIELGRIDLATFANPAGLQKVGSTYFEESLNSGDPVVVVAGTEGTGQIMASTLEASNVDLSNEFSDMIMTQRGFQASSRVITVSDTMLEELINLKR